MTEDEKDRIRLAEAIGRRHPLGKHYGGGVSELFGGPSGYIEPFDPFTDANDDYAVLEWMRKNWTDQQQIDALEALPMGNYMDAYQIGDYARAALKVIDNAN